MNDLKDLVKKRNITKAKKPRFQRQDANIMKHLRGSWRKPKGIHSKLREHRKGHGHLPAVGYSSPRSVFGLTRSGYIPVAVANVADLVRIKENCVAIISSGVGMRKRVEIVKKAKELKLKILGLKDYDSFLNEVSEALVSKKKISNERKNKKIEIIKKKQEEKKEDKKETEKEVQPVEKQQ